MTLSMFDSAAFLLSNPRRLLGAAHFLGSEVNRRLLYRKSPEGVRVLDETWGNLLILDACRYDVFAEHHPFQKGRLEKRRSLGSDSWGFIQRNFAGEKYHDTVYISANPFTRTIPDGTFHAVHNLLKKYWDGDAGTVRPEAVVDMTRSLANRYDDKRLIVHFMQPHFPPIGPTAEQIDSAGIVELDEDQNPLWSPEERGIWTLLRFNDPAVTVDAAWESYLENFSIVCDHVKILLEELSGRSVITADHGNLFGEWTGPIPARAYGHPRDLFVDELVEVPWYIVEGERRQTSSDPPVAVDKVDETIMKDRLASLGYREL